MNLDTNNTHDSVNFDTNVVTSLSKALTHTKGFLVFSGGIKWEHWPEMG